MKKILPFATIITALIINCVSVFGATVNIKHATPQPDNSIVVKGMVSEPSENQILTIMSTESTYENGYDVNSIIYIDQLESQVDANGNFTISFVPSQDMKDNTMYCVRIGGSNVSTPAYMLIVNDSVIPIGDANGDTIIDSSDAVLVLESVLDNTSDQLSGKSRVVDGITVTANDASYILKKVIDPNFVFPIETKTN